MSTATPARQQQNGTPAAMSKGDFLARLDEIRPDIAKVLPEGISVDRFIYVVRVAYAQNPDLARCSPGSVMMAVMQAAELGLEIGKPLDYCHLVPFKGQCTLMIDYKGMVHLAHNAGALAALDSRVVYERDEFDVHYDPLPVFTHRPYLGGDRGRPTHVYAYAKLRGGELHMEVMTAAEVEAIRQAASSRNSPAWQNHWDETARKTPLKRMLKRLPKSTRLARAIELDDALYDLARMHVSGPPRAGTKSSRLADKIGAPALPAPEPEFTADEGVAAPLRSEDDGPTQEELDADAEA